MKLIFFQHFLSCVLVEDEICLIVLQCWLVFMVGSHGIFAREEAACVKARIVSGQQRGHVGKSQWDGRRKDEGRADWRLKAGFVAGTRANPTRGQTRRRAEKLVCINRTPGSPCRRLFAAFHDPDCQLRDDWFGRRSDLFFLLLCAKAH